MTSMPIPAAVLAAYGLAGEAAGLQVEHVPSNINQTYVIRPRDPGRSPLVLQRLHPVFGAQVHVDIEAVTAHLAARGVTTPRLIHSVDDRLWVEHGTGPSAHVWRALTYIDGVTLHSTADPERLASAAALLGRFHHALLDLQHRFVHERPLHDTQRHLAKLRAALASDRARGDDSAQELGARILRHAERARIDFGALPRRTIHGDPKLSNVMFDRLAPDQAKCMIDLDTVGHGYLAYELGDALRSWCNPAGEDTTSAHVDMAAFAAVLRGYGRTCPEAITADELASSVDGLETVSIELAGRFAADVIDDSYFGWDPLRFASRREHNLLRARGQLALSEAVRAQRPELEAVLRSTSARRHGA
jgi:Ser/Thr protein kinase RdoA (MazF antagonist)